MISAISNCTNACRLLFNYMFFAWNTQHMVRWNVVPLWAEKAASVSQKKNKQEKENNWRLNEIKEI